MKFKVSVEVSNSCGIGTYNRFHHFISFIHTYIPTRVKRGLSIYTRARVKRCLNTSLSEVL